jgi:hypothetical protein
MRTTVSKTSSSLLLILAVGAIWASAAAAQSGSQTTLVVQVPPEAYLEGPSAATWDDGEAGAEVQVPIRALLRLNRGATADLNISTEAGEMIEVRRPAGFVALSGSPISLQQLTRSGAYDFPLVLRRAPGTDGAASATIRLDLLFSDGSAGWSRTIHIH